MPAEERLIRQAVARLRRRLRLQAAVRWGALAATVAACAVAIGVALYQLWILPPDIVAPYLYAALGVVALGILIGVVRRYDRVSLAQRLDRANDLKDRLGTALVILEKPEDQRTDFERAQLTDAMRHAERAQHQPAAPWRFPREVVWVAGLVGLAWGLTWIQMEPPGREGHGLRPVFFGESSGPVMLPPDVLAEETPAEDAVPEEVVEAIEEQIAENQTDLAPLVEDDPEAKQFVSELNKLLEELATGEADDRELTRAASELESELAEMAGTPEEQHEAEELAEKIEEMAQQLEKQAERSRVKDPEIKETVKELAKALEERRYEDAARKMEELLQKWNQLSKRDQERLAKMFEDLAKKFQSQMAKDLEKLKKERSRLARKEKEQGGLNKRERRRLDRLDKQLDKLQKQYDQQTAEHKKQLDQLTRDMKDMANRMRRQDEQQQQQANQQEKSEAAQRKSRLSQEEMERLKKMLERMSKQQRRQRLKKQGQMKLADLKELMKRRRGMSDETKKRLERLARMGKKGKESQGREGKQGKEGGEPGGDSKERRQMLTRTDKKEDATEWQRRTKPMDTLTTSGEAKPGEGVGHSRDRMLQGAPTEIEAEMKEDFVKGQQGKGMSEREILYGAASQGTRVEGYGKVHIDYSMRASRQMEDEEVPPGYREYVEQYFELIRER